MAPETDSRGLPVGCDRLIPSGENAAQLLHPFLTGGGQVYGRALHGHLHRQIQGRVGAMVAQQLVALLQGAGVAYQVVEIERVGLGYHYVHQAAAFLARACHQVAVGRGGNHQGESPDVGAETFVFLPRAFEAFPFAGLQPEGQLLIEPAPEIAAPQCGESLPSAYQLHVGQPREAFAETEVIYGVEEVAFAHAVVAQETVDLGGELEARLGDVLEIRDC